MRKIYLLLFAVFYQLIAFSQTVTIGTGTSTASNSPYNSFYGYSYVQTIYRQPEISATGNITSISYYYAGTSLSSSDLVDIYMGITPKDSFSTTTDWILLSGLTQVFTGQITGFSTLPGWVDITLATPFAYTNTGNLVIAVHEYQPGYNTSTRYQGTTITTPKNRVLGYWNDATNPDPAAPPTGTFSNIVGNIKIDGLTLVGCQPITGLTVSNPTVNGAEISWTAPAGGATVNGYDYEIRTSGAAGSGSTGLVTTGTVTGVDTILTNLSSSSTYTVYVRANCGAGGTGLWVGGVTFSTACAVVSNFFQNFDQATGLPNCWSKILRGATLPTAASITTTATAANVYSAPNAVSMYNSGATATDDIILVSPQVNNLDSANHRLTFYAKNSVATEDVEVGTLSDTTVNATFTPLQTVDINTTYAKYSVDFSSYSGSDQFIGIRRLSTSTYTYVYLDNITWEKIPSCVEPTGLYSTMTTTSGAYIGWVAPTTAPANYQIYVSTSATAPTDTTTATITGVADTTYTFTTLMPATKYYVWVRSSCGTNGNSPWSSSTTFTTECVAVSSFYQNFDSVTVPALPVCWRKVGTGGSASTQTANPNSAPNTLYIYSGSAASQAVVAMIPVDNAGANTHWLTFQARANFTVGGVIEVGYLTDPNDPATFTLIQAVTISSLTYQSYSVAPGSINPGATTVFAFRHTGSPANSVLIDDVSWVPMPGCIEPTGVTADAATITSTSATINWTAPATTPIYYGLYLSTSNTRPADTATATIDSILSTTQDLMNLSPSTTYYVWVRSVCDTAGGMSTWSSMGTFTTACGVIITPSATAQNFDQMPPNCWTRARGVLSSASTLSGTTSNWVQDDFANVTTPVNKSAKINIYGTTRQDWLITPVYDLGTTNDKKLEFDLALTVYAATTTATLGPDDKFAIVISTDNGVTWSDANVLRMWDSTSIISNTGEHVVIDLSTYTGQVMFGFYGESTVSNADNDLFVDNVTVTQGLLPVTLVSFKGERQGAANFLTWSTATEQNNKGFELQRSTNGSEFAAIGYVKSKAIGGNSTSTLNYNFTDTKPVSGNNYYRLKQINTDNRATLSNIVLIKGAGSGLELSSVYPNPAKSRLNLVVTAPASDRVNFIVTDLAGKVVMQQASNVNNGTNNVSLNVERLAAGTYLLKAVCNTGCETAVSKFVKQ